MGTTQAQIIETMPQLGDDLTQGRVFSPAASMYLPHSKDQPEP